MALGLLISSCAPPSPSFPVTILADPGTHSSVETAAAAEDSVDWWDADPADDDACTESFAAAELARFLPRALGVAPGQIRLAPAGRLPDRGDVIVVGTRASRALGRPKPGPAWAADVPREAYRLRALSERGRTVIVIEGASRSGTLAGAYALLDRLGVRFHQPGDSSAVFPAPARLPTRLDFNSTPAYDLRGFWAWEPRGNDEFFVWMARNHFNLWTAAEPRAALLAKLGIRLSGGGHHIQQQYLDPGTHFAAHPEWFGFENGARHPGIEGESGLNFCTSNVEAVRELTGALVQDLSRGTLRHADLVQVWPLDGGRWCACSACAMQGSPTDRWLTVVAEAVRAVESERRTGRLVRRVTLHAPAYLETSAAPTRPAPAILDTGDVAVAYFPYFRCYAHPLGDPRCYEINRALASRYLGWAAGNERPYRGAMAIGEYYNVSWVKSLPVLMPHVMAADLADFARLGARHFFYMHAPTRRFGTWALNHALLSRLLWNPAADVDSLIADFTAREYPGAGREMREFYSALERGTANLLAVQHAVGSVGSGNNPRLLDPRIPVFALRHLSDAPGPAGPDSAASLSQMAEAMASARRALDGARSKPGDARTSASLRDVEERFAYGEAMIEFWTALIRAAAAHREARPADLRIEMARADDAAARLREVRDLVQVGASHANARDGLEASGAARVYERLRALAKSRPRR
ncbi:MAG: DUF4838 domain-containing protein [Candidatus Eisenbacteria bacterium]